MGWDAIGRDEIGPASLGRLGLNATRSVQYLIWPETERPSSVWCGYKLDTINCTRGCQTSKPYADDGLGRKWGPVGGHTNTRRRTNWSAKFGLPRRARLTLASIVARDTFDRCRSCLS